MAVVLGFEPFATSPALGRKLENPSAKFLEALKRGEYDLGSAVRTVLLPVPSINEGLTDPRKILSILRKALAEVGPDEIVIGLGQGHVYQPGLLLETKFSRDYATLDHPQLHGTDELDASIVEILSEVNGVCVSSDAGVNECNLAARELANQFPRRSAFFHVAVCTPDDFAAYSVHSPFMLNEMEAGRVSIAYEYEIAEVLRETNLRLKKLNKF